MARAKDSLFYHFDTLAAFGAHMEREHADVADHSSNTWAGGTFRNTWAGGTFRGAIDFARHGDISKVAAATALVEKLDSEIDSNSVRPLWMPSVVGNFPIVPAYLAGTPEAMMARTEVPDARGELEIWANTTVSANCKAADMMRRGVVTMAFAMALSRVRNVKMVLYSTTNSSNVAIHLSCPMDISEVCAAFCQPSITRHLVYGHARRDGFDGRWSCWADAVNGSRDKEGPALEQYAGMPADAIRLSTEKLGSYADTSDDELVGILNAKVREYMER